MGRMMRRMMRRMTGMLLLGLALGVAGAEPAAAQERPRDRAQERERLLPPGAAFLGVGVSRIGSGGLEDRLAARGYPTFGRTAMAFSLGAYGILPGGLTVGAEWHGLNVGHGTHEGRAMDLGGGYGTVGLGYMVELSPRARVYPRIGLGGGGLGLWMETDSGTVDFDDVLASPQPAPLLREPVLSSISALVDLGVGAEILPGGWGRGLVVGLRLGYLVAPFDSDWRLHNKAVNDAPAASIGGAYIRALIGVGQ